MGAVCRVGRGRQWRHGAADQAEHRGDHDDPVGRASSGPPGESAMMRKILGYTTLVALSLMMAPKPAVAHHALAAEFDFAKRGEFVGVLTKFAIINPHVRWYFDVK